MKKQVSKVGKSVTRAEFRLQQELEGKRHTLPVRVLDKIGTLGDQPELRLLSAATIVAGLFGNPRLLRAGMRMLLAHELTTWAKSQVKDRVDRTRPRSATRSEQSKPKRGSNPAKEESSFPSGHTAGAVAVAQAFSREFPEHATVARSAAAVVGLAQVPRCAHYPTDVGAGALLGVAGEAAIAALWPGKDQTMMKSAAVTVA